MKFEICGFEHNHNHGNYSLLDGISSVKDMCERAKQANMRNICITDHASMSVIPSQIRMCEEYGLNHIFGCEFYISPFQEPCPTKESLEQFLKNLDPEQTKQWRKNYHFLGLAFNEVGYKNLVKLNSWSYANGWGGNPRRARINRELLQAHKEGIIWSSCCYMSEIGQSFDKGGESAGEEMLQLYIAMLGKENFVLEIMMLDFEKQKPYDKFIIKMAEKYGMKIMLTQDSHYAQKEDAKQQKYTLMVRGKRTLKDIQTAIDSDPNADFFELQDQNLWMKSEDELNEFWEAKYKDIIPYEIFCSAKRESVNISNKCKNIKLDRSMKLPKIPDADSKLWDLILEGIKKRNIPKTKEYMKRILEEYDLIVRKEFSSYFLIQREIINEAKNKLSQSGLDGANAVGPGRGSVCGSLVCYILQITDVNPIPYKLLWSRFLSESRGKSIKFKFSDKALEGVI